MARRKKARVTTNEDIENEDEESHQNQYCNKPSYSTQKSLYEILGVERTASHQEIRKAYHKLALQLHPDKNPGDENAKEKFQQLQKVISVLGDQEKRSLYDQTGCVEDADLAGDFDQVLKEFLHSLFREVTEATVEEFEANYRGSKSEKKDLIDLFKKCKGNMSRLFCEMLCADENLDSHRFKDILDVSISEGVLKSNKAYVKWANQVAQTKPPTSPLKRKKRSKHMSDDPSAIITQRQAVRRDGNSSLFSSFLNKYGVGAMSEPSEEEFQAARRRLESKIKSRRK